MKHQSGSVLIYVLIAIVLFAALSFALARMGGDGGSGGRLNSDRADIKAQELIQYANAARTTIEQMRTMTNVLPNEFSFVKLGDANYDTAPHTAKVFHPAGGGLNVFSDTPDLFASSASTRGWSGQQGTNVQWSATTGSDIIFTFVDVAQPICAAINKRLFKDESIPTLSLTSSAAFINGGGDDADFTIASCASCNGRPSMCVRDSAGAYAFYNILLSR